MRPILACIVTPLALFACSGSSPSQETTGQDAGSGAEADLRHTFTAVEIEPGQEITSLCQSWTIGNDEPLYVNSVRALNSGVAPFELGLRSRDELRGARRHMGVQRARVHSGRRRHARGRVLRAVDAGNRLLLGGAGDSL
ncbi:MAG TPA: hypothetical protein VK540_21200 [Polyangiaceae bacterium]|jgi:hypothetical protein|nr:hypothetical protein [Polyangiaceae bacterium]